MKKYNTIKVLYHKYNINAFIQPPWPWKMACLECLTLQHTGLHHKSPQLLLNALVTFCRLYMISDVHKTVTVLSVSSDLTNTQILWNFIHTLVIMFSIHDRQQRRFWKQFKYSFPVFTCNYTEEFELLNFLVIPSVSFHYYILLQWITKQPYLWQRTWACKSIEDRMITKEQSKGQRSKWIWPMQQ
jgi:hypothetical protein